MKIIKKSFGCAVVVFLGMILLGFLCLAFYEKHFGPHATYQTYQMNHDPKTKAYVKNYTGVIFPDSANWEKCYFDPAWDGYVTFCAKLSIPEKDVEEMIPDDIDYEHFQNGLPLLSPESSGIYSSLRNFKEIMDIDIGKLSDIEFFYYNDDHQNGHRNLLFAIDHASKLSHGHIVVYIYSSGYGFRLGKIVPFPE